MGGWLEWFGFTGGMILGGIGLLAFVFNPLLFIVLGGAFGVLRFLLWMASGPPRPQDISSDSTRGG